MFLKKNIFHVNISNAQKNCYRQVNQCVPLNYSACLDVSLPYKYTADVIPIFDLAAPEIEYDQLIDIMNVYLERWKGLRLIPQCWKVLQTVICALLFPRCDNETSRIILPTFEMCRSIRSACRIIDQHFKWPDYLQCNNNSLFSSTCLNYYNDLKFSGSIAASRCAPPLVSTDDSRIWFPGFSGCSLHCINSIYTEEQTELISKIIAFGAGLSFLATLFAVLTFLLNQACLKRRFYTSIIFYMNICILISTLGWSFQFFKGRQEVICRPDNTTRYGEPSKNDHFYCSLSFFLIYYFSFAALIWFVHLFQVFYTTFYALSNGNKVSFNKFQFHMSAWSVPLILTTFIFLLGEIDGDSLRGICFVGLMKLRVRIIFVIIPFSISKLIGTYHCIKTISILFNTIQNCDSGSRRKRNIAMALIRITFYITANLIIYLVIFSIYIYEQSVETINYRHFSDYLVCNLKVNNVLVKKMPTNYNDYEDVEPQYYSTSNNTGLTDSYSEVNFCHNYQPPNIWPICIQMIAIFIANILVSTWVWTSATIATWKRFLCRYFNGKKVQALRLKPHELISNSYIKKDRIQQGLYVPSMTSNHNDPVDMDINSARSQSVSTNFQQNFNALLGRRYALCENEVCSIDLILFELN